jgi:hypothetical protein
MRKGGGSLMQFGRGSDLVKIAMNVASQQLQGGFLSRLHEIGRRCCCIAMIV